MCTMPRCGSSGDEYSLSMNTRVIWFPYKSTEGFAYSVCVCMCACVWMFVLVCFPTFRMMSGLDASTGSVNTSPLMV